MDATLNWRHFPTTQLDTRAIGLMALFGIVFAGALTASPLLQSTGTQSVVSGHSAAEQAGGGLVWAVVEVTFAALLLGIILVYRRAPAWLQAAGREGAVVGFWVTAALYTVFTVGGFVGWLGVPATAALKAGFEQQRLYWLFNDVLALALAVVIGAQVGLLFGPVVVAVGLIALTGYDVWFADRKEWMFTLAAATARWKLPMLFIAPTVSRLRWEQLADADDGLDAESFHFVIGTADLLLPAALTVAVAADGVGLPAWGIIAGVTAACLRLSAKIESGGGAGLPPITTGALGGWAVASALKVVV